MYVYIYIHIYIYMYIYIYIACSNTPAQMSAIPTRNGHSQHR